MKILKTIAITLAIFLGCSLWVGAGGGPKIVTAPIQSWTKKALTITGMWSFSNIDINGGEIDGTAIATTLTISAGVSVYELKSSTMSELSGTSIYSAYLTGVSVSTRSPTSGVSTRVASGTGRGENLVFFLQDDTAQSGNTIGVHFTSGDVIASADTITAGVSKYIMSGTTDAQIIIAISTGVSKWWVRTTGGPSVAWD